ncbi:MAG: hypothetical protein Q9194_000844 [Teloschistes cf. exilis]
MRMSQAHSKAKPAVFIALLLSPQTVSPSPEKRLLDLRQEQSIAKHAPGSVKIQAHLQTFVLEGSRPEPRSPIETPPTEYLPYPPPPNYSWPPGPHTQYPPPSETNAPAGWYGGTGTGGQGNSGAGSASGSSAQTSGAVQSLHLPSLFHIPLDVLLLILPPFLLSFSSSMMRPPRARATAETPPTEFLPYPPPPKYQWLPGQSPQVENPRVGMAAADSPSSVGAEDGGEREGKGMRSVGKDKGRGRDGRRWASGPLPPPSPPEQLAAAKE